MTTALPKIEKLNRFCVDCLERNLPSPSQPRVLMVAGEPVIIPGTCFCCQSSDVDVCFMARTEFEELARQRKEEHGQ